MPDVYEPVGVDVRLEVVDGDEGPVQRVGHCFGGIEAYDKRPRQSGSLRGGYGIEVIPLDGSLSQSLLDHGNYRGDVLACRELRHDASVLTMEIDLRRDDGREDSPPVGNNGGCRLITGRFDAEHDHRRRPSTNWKQVSITLLRLG